MALEFQVTFDAHDPRALGDFWALALGYVRQPPPPGFDDWEAALTSWGMTPDQFNDFNALVDPEGDGPRLFIQRVPEDKGAKNRVHLDVNVGGEPDGRPDRVRAHVATLVTAGAQVVEEYDLRGEFWIVLQDPEGNEFCVQ